MPLLRTVCSISNIFIVSSPNDWMHDYLRVTDGHLLPLACQGMSSRNSALICCALLRQAMDRCHRIGQTKPVLVLRLATAHSVEGRLLKRARSKLALERLVIKKGAFLHQQVSA